jgi:hypothetical protein
MDDRIVKIQELLYIKSKNKKKAFLNIYEVNEILDVLKKFENKYDKSQITVSKNNFDKVLKEKENLDNINKQLIEENTILKKKINDYNNHAKKEIEEIQLKIQKLYIK